MAVDFSGYLHDTERVTGQIDGEDVWAELRVMGQLELMRKAPHLLGAVKEGMALREKVGTDLTADDITVEALEAIEHGRVYEVGSLAASIVEVGGFEVGEAPLVWADLDESQRERFVEYLRRVGGSFYRALQARLRSFYEVSRGELGE